MAAALHILDLTALLCFQLGWQIVLLLRALQSIYFASQDQHFIAKLLDNLILQEQMLSMPDVSGSCHPQTHTCHRHSTMRVSEPRLLGSFRQLQLSIHS